MSLALKCLALLVVIGVVTSTPCHGDDPSSCMGLTCSNPGEMVGCEHHVCSCVQNTTQPAGQACMQKSDCDHLPKCHGHGQDMHCYDGTCRCAHI